MNIKPLFLDSNQGRLFALAYSPDPFLKSSSALLFVPPFAEEMNKSRRMFNLQARALAKQGVASLLLDLYGTGDSEGGFVEARWDIWQENLLTAIRWLHSQGYSQVSLLGLRSGALMASSCLLANNLEIERLIFWQPVASGKTMFTQFLRMEVAEAMLNSATEKQTTAALWQNLALGQPVEVAGYSLHPELAYAFEHASLEHIHSDNFPKVFWFEVVASESKPLSLKTERLVSRLSTHGVDVQLGSIVGPPFWQTLEISEAPELVQRTTALFGTDDE